MRLIKMVGGLGNQMFIYAFYLQMKQRYPGVQLDISDIVHYKAHNGYELLRVFDLPIQEFCLPQWLKKVAEALCFRIILERKQNLETMEAFSKDYWWPWIYFKGFYQSERFFSDVKDEVRARFCFNIEKANPYSQTLYRRIQTDSHAVSFHVRRDDYQLPKFYKRFGSVCTEAYYQRAIERMLQHDAEAHFYVFSDDLPWVKAHFDFPRVTFVDGNTGADSWQDMMLMSCCRHHVIANSSFAWWGAWLNPRADKLVLAPKRWFGDVEMPYILPEGWVGIEA